MRDAFSQMDVSVDIATDSKFRRIAHGPRADLLAPCFMVYVALLGESWKAGRRVPLDDAWPMLLPFDQDVVDELDRVGLIDDGLVGASAWEHWFGPAMERRANARERWHRWREAHRGETPPAPPQPTNHPTNQLPPPFANRTQTVSGGNGQDKSTSFVFADGAPLAEGDQRTESWREIGAVFGSQDEEHVQCRSYETHRDHHHREGTVWVCDLCRESAA